ncbi:MAG: Acg family FMN-binding oxidoreductase [Paracoccaceae bacterium]
MPLSRRAMLLVLGGGTILAATAGAATVATRRPRTATLPWAEAGTPADAREWALSYALLAPNPHNRQPWLVDLSVTGQVTLFADRDRLLPVTDPMNRQITIGLGAFLELMRMAAAEKGLGVTLTPFPDGASPEGLDARPIARAVFAPDAGVGPDPLFAHVLARRSNKEPYDTARPVPAGTLAALSAAVVRGSVFGGTTDTAQVGALRRLTHEALRIEFMTPRTLGESIELFRIGRNEVDANPDGIDFSGPLFEILGATGLFSRATAGDHASFAFRSALDMIETTSLSAMGHVWLVTAGNSREEQLAAGADWVRLNLALTGLGLGVQPMSQALQEFPEMAGPFAEAHRMLAPAGGVVQMLGRIGYGAEVDQSPRWPLQTRIIHA